MSGLWICAALRWQVDSQHALQGSDDHHFFSIKNSHQLLQRFLQSRLRFIGRDTALLQSLFKIAVASSCCVACCKRNFKITTQHLMETLMPVPMHFYCRNADVTEQADKQSAYNCIQTPLTKVLMPLQWLSKHCRVHLVQ